MISKVLVVLSLVAVALSASVSKPTQWETQLVDTDLPSDVREYLDEQLVNLPEDVTEVELTQPPLALQEAALSKFNFEENSNRVKRRVVVCRYVVIRVRKTGRKIVVVRCR